MLSRTLLAAAIVLVAPAIAMAQTPDAQPPAAPGPATPTVPPSPALTAAGDMMATLKGNPHFTILVKALDATNLSPILAATPQLTLFAPTDEAFNALPPGVLAGLTQPANLPILQKVLTYHLVHLDLEQSKVKGAKGPVQSVEGQQLQVDGFGATPQVDGGDILQEGVHATNGWIYPIDKVLTPSDVTLPH